MTPGEAKKHAKAFKTKMEALSKSIQDNEHKVGNMNGKRFSAHNDSKCALSLIARGVDKLCEISGANYDDL